MCPERVEKRFRDPSEGKLRVQYKLAKIERVILVKEIPALWISAIYAFS